MVTFSLTVGLLNGFANGIRVRHDMPTMVCHGM